METELRQQAHYWQAQHARAVEREAAWKDKAQQLEQVVRRQQARIAELTGELEAAKARIAWLEKQVFGRKSEQCPEPGQPDPTPAIDGNADAADGPQPGNEPPRKRGKQPGAKGYGRKRRDDLPAEETVHDLPEDQKQCPRCGKPFDGFPKTEDSEQIEWEVVLYRRIHKRSQYLPTCDCRAVPGIVAAPCPPKLIRRGMFATSFWVRLLMEKFLFQRPLHRVRKVLALEGLWVSQGTLTGGLQRIGELLQPVYTRILERSRTANHWKMDETRWLVFEETEGKDGYRWWLWVVITDDTVVFLLEPTRSAQVPRDHLGEDPEGIINADRYSVYKALGLKILVAFCWSHVRRDFVRVRDGYRRLRRWGEAWVTRINELFTLNEWFFAYFEACARNGGRVPHSLDEFMPWQTSQDSSLWNELIERYHYLGYKPLPGAQIRYLVFHGSHLLAALGFSAAAWKVAPRDRFIGWSDQQRRCSLQQVANNSRFLILPWVKAPNLASCILGTAAKRLRRDWQDRYGYAPVLVETFVDRDRFQGTCYRAANWIYVGETQGRGKLDRRHRHPLPVKRVYLYPLHKHFRQKLRAAAEP
ncbi:MAG: Druantia anti-phage system protein DruA [Phycisphaerae bacterium]